MTSASSAWNDDEQHVGLAGRRAADAGDAVARPASTTEARDPQLELQSVTRYHLTTEASTIDPAEERELAGKPLVSEHRGSTELGERLDHEHARERRSAGKVAGEERLFTAQVPPPAGAHTRIDLRYLGQEEERWPVGQDVLGTERSGGSHRRRRGPPVVAAVSTASGAPAGLREVFAPPDAPAASPAVLRIEGAAVPDLATPEERPAREAAGTAEDFAARADVEDLGDPPVFAARPALSAPPALASPPDLPAPPDLAGPPDLAAALDLAAAGDLAPAGDSARAGELPARGDCAAPEERAAAADLRVPADLAALEDFVAVGSRAAPVDFASAAWLELAWVDAPAAEVALSVDFDAPADLAAPRDLATPPDLDPTPGALVAPTADRGSTVDPPNPAGLVAASVVLSVPLDLAGRRERLPAAARAGLRLAPSPASSVVSLAAADLPGRGELAPGALVRGDGGSEPPGAAALLSASVGRDAAPPPEPAVGGRRSAPAEGASPPFRPEVAAFAAWGVFAALLAPRGAAAIPGGAGGGRNGGAGAATAASAFDTLARRRRPPLAGWAPSCTGAEPSSAESEPRSPSPTRPPSSGVRLRGRREPDGAPAPASVAARSVATRSVATRSVAVLSVAARSVAARPVAGRPVAARPVGATDAGWVPAAPEGWRRAMRFSAATVSSLG